MPASWWVTVLGHATTKCTGRLLVVEEENLMLVDPLTRTVKCNLALKTITGIYRLNIKNANMGGDSIRNYILENACKITFKVAKNVFSENDSNQIDVIIVPRVSGELDQIYYKLVTSRNVGGIDAPSHEALEILKKLNITQEWGLVKMTCIQLFAPEAFFDGGCTGTTSFPGPSTLVLGFSHEEICVAKEISCVESTVDTHSILKRYSYSDITRFYVRKKDTIVLRFTDGQILRFTCLPDASCRTIIMTLLGRIAFHQQGCPAKETPLGYFEDSDHFSRLAQIAIKQANQSVIDGPPSSSPIKISKPSSLGADEPIPAKSCADVGTEAKDVLEKARELLSKSDSSDTKVKDLQVDTELISTSDNSDTKVNDLHVDTELLSKGDSSDTKVKDVQVDNELLQPAAAISPPQKSSVHNASRSPKKALQGMIRRVSSPRLSKPIDREETSSPLYKNRNYSSQLSRSISSPRTRREDKECQLPNVATSTHESDKDIPNNSNGDTERVDTIPETTVTNVSKAVPVDDTVFTPSKKKNSFVNRVRVVSSPHKRQTDEVESKEQNSPNMKKTSLKGSLRKKKQSLEGGSKRQLKKSVSFSKMKSKEGSCKQQ